MPPRIPSLDQFRGFLLWLMITTNVMMMFSFVPEAFRHSIVYGRLNLTDLGAPIFFFTIGLSLALSFDRYLIKHGRLNTILRYIKRGIIFILLGTIGVILLRHNPLYDWSVLQTIGGAGLFALPFVFLPSRWRWLAGVGLIVIFQIIAALGYTRWIEDHDFGGLGGPLGGLAWGGVILFGASLGALLLDNWVKFLQRGFMMAGLALISVAILAQFQSIDKRLATAPYLALTIGLGTLLIIFFAFIERQWRLRMRPLSILGANSLIVFVLQGLSVIIGSRFIPSSTPYLPAFLFLFFVYALCFSVTAFLNHNKIYFRL